MRLTAALLTFLFGIAVLNKQVWCSESEYKDPDYPDDDAGADEDEELQPEILSKSEMFTVNAGESITLPCKIENSDGAVIQWRKDDKPLFFDRTRQIQDMRFSMELFSLHIKDVKLEDAGKYNCELLNMEIFIQHQLFVRSKPKITRLVPDGALKQMNKDTPLTLMCEAAGFPKPTISWTHKKKHSNVEEALEGEVITYDLVSKANSGDFTCTAKNSEGIDRKSIKIDVHYEPEIETSKEIVYSAEGYESELECTVHAHPAAKVFWFKNNTKLVNSHHINQLFTGNTHFLRITNTKANDFGMYKCLVTNEIGTVNKTITLTGLPSTPTLVSTTVADDNKSPKLSFEVTSMSPIQSFQLLYKKQQDDKWDTIMTPIVQSKDKPSVYTATHIFKNLEPGTYVAQVRANNAYGWSSYSEIKTFSGDAIGGTGAAQSTYLESSMSEASYNEMRISVVFILSLLVARLLS